MTNWESLGYKGGEPFFLSPQDTSELSSPALVHKFSVTP